MPAESATSTAPVFPVALLLRGRPCVVVGGGPVAARKARDLAACDAVVTVVAREVCAQVAALQEEFTSLRIVERHYAPHDVDGAALVIAATGVHEVDASVAEDAASRGIWVNCADDPGHCDFYLTSVHRSGAVAVSVSTGGASPALARWLRRRIALEVGPEFGALATLLGVLRATLHEQGVATEGLAWDELLTDELVAAVRDDDLESVSDLTSTWLAMVP